MKRDKVEAAKTVVGEAVAAALRRREQQQAPPQPVPPQPAPYVLTVTGQDLLVVAAGLNELPRKLVQELLERLQAQVSAQDAARQKA